MRAGKPELDMPGRIFSPRDVIKVRRPTGSTTIPTSALATQLAAEHWLTTNPQAQVTQIAAEHWASITGTGEQAVVTQMAAEHWASVASIVPSRGGPIVTMIG